MKIKWMEQKKQYRLYRERIDGLPSNYRSVVEAMERYINYLGGIDDPDSILTMLDDLAGLFEQAAVYSTPIREIVGDNPVEFINDFLSNYPAGKWIVRERERLVASVNGAAGDTV